MKIDIWSDYACPFCYIGKRHLEKAIEQFEHRESIEAAYRSYQLAPDMEVDIADDMNTMLAKKYGMSIEEAKRNGANVVAMAKAAGLDYNYDAIKLTNTLDAHRLAQYAKEEKKDKEMTEILLKAYFVDALHIGKHDTLRKLAAEIGLNNERVEEVLATDLYKDEVLHDQSLAAQIGVRGVPFFVFNNKYALSGAQPVEAFLEVLQKVWEEENGSSIQVINPVSEEDKTGVCTDESCEL